MSAKNEDPNDEDLGEYTDYLLLSSARLTRGWRHNVMRLAPSQTSDISEPKQWDEAKLNRRDLFRLRREEEEAARVAAQAAEAAKDGSIQPDAAATSSLKPEQLELKPGMPGYTAAAAAAKKETEERDDSLVAPGPLAAGQAAAPRPKRGFGAPKKTRRVFITEQSSKNRRLHFEEQHPWVLETVDKQKPPSEVRWIGQMDSSASTDRATGDGSNYVLLVLDNSPGHEAAFKVVPANRWYRFTSRPKYAALTADEAEAEYKRIQKSKDMDSWFANRRTAPAVSTTSVLNGGLNLPGSSAGNSRARAAPSIPSRYAKLRQSQQINSRSTGLRTVITDDGPDDMGHFDDEEAAGPSQRRAGKMAIKPRRRAALADDQYEEFDFEEDFQDDEEGIGQVGDEAIEDVDTRELEERIKREMRAANKVGDLAVESDDENEEIDPELTRAGKRVKKLLVKRGRKGKPEDEEDDVDDLDDDDTRNPYASSEEAVDSEDERNLQREAEHKAIEKERASQQQQQGKNVPPLARSASEGGPRLPGALPSRAPSVGPRSRAASPNGGVTGANALVRRATSPSGLNSRRGSPTPPPSASKRKAEEGASPTASEDGSRSDDKSKKRRKAGSASPPPQAMAPGDDSALIPRNDIILYIKDSRPTTKELLKHFKSAMARDTRNRDIILQVTKEVASMGEEKRLVVKSEFL